MARIARSPGPSVVADTHALIWYVTAPAMLSASAVDALERAVVGNQPIRVAAVSLIELVYIAEKRSDSIDADTLRQLLEMVEEPGSPITVAPMSVDVARAMISIPAPRSATRSTGPSWRPRGQRSSGL